MAINRERKLRTQIKGNSVLKTMAITLVFFYKSRLIANQNASRNEMAITLECTC